MESYRCTNCGAPLRPGENKCSFCGAVYDIPVANAEISYSTEDDTRPVKSKITATILAFLLGGVGAHKFYLGKIGQGVFYVIFCLTGIPSVVGLIEGITYLVMNDQKFEEKFNVRIKN